MDQESFEREVSGLVPVLPATQQDVAEAESLLREIAIGLVRLPFDETASPLHLRVLALRPIIVRWLAEPPTRSRLEVVLESLRVLRARVLEMRAAAPPGSPERESSDIAAGLSRRRR